MSKIVVYLLDKIVWILLAAVVTGQALQIAGLMSTPKSAGALEYQNSLSHIHHFSSLRWRRDTTDLPERNQFIDMLFNRKKQIQPKETSWTQRLQTAMSYFNSAAKIPIKTLTSINNFIQNSRPAIRKFRDVFTKRFERTTKAPDTDLNTIQKRSYPVYIRPVGEQN
ncbi:uncharacterized protein LOC126738940 [Anthonomus grandis grandis]|uniref:uncharacterized protein LOC126738940 n=1 Tax=Anthonomus grandis grandis TaxID=2921223 RepID=UPI0021662F33|nr:uncharacterized protein LOC126738940 [Anthonomus grandis grandis]